MSLEIFFSGKLSLADGATIRLLSGMHSVMHFQSCAGGT